MRPDTLIIGAGIIGLCIARELHKRGERNIVLLDRSDAGSESSWAAAGMLSPQAEARETDSFLRFCSEARDRYPAFAEELRSETGIDIELDRTGTICVACSDRESLELAERAGSQDREGLDVQRLSAAEIRELEPELSEKVRDGLLFPNDWQVENRKVIQALIEYAKRYGILIRERIEARKLIIENGEVTGVETEQGNIYCGRVIITAGAWTSQIEPLPAVVRPMRGQMICFHPERRLLRHVVYGTGCYIVPRRDGRILVGATVEDVGFDKSVTEEAVKLLRDNGLEMVPALGNVKMMERWCGFRPFASDGLPVLGCVSGIENLALATGHFRNGILLAPLTGSVIADHLYGTESPYLSLYGPARFASRSAGSA